MKKINVFDTYLIIKDREGITGFNEDLLEKLDNILDQFGVDHAFCECRNEDLIANENSVLTVMYNESDDTKFFLAYALFIQTYRNATDDMIIEAMKKHIERRS